MVKQKSKPQRVEIGGDVRVKIAGIDALFSALSPAMKAIVWQAVRKGLSCHADGALVVPESAMISCSMSWHKEVQ